MVTAVTREMIEEIATESRPDLDSYQNCNPINPRIQAGLDDHGISAELVTGMISSEYRGHGDEHLFVTVPSDAVETTTGPLIVDGALDQFCISNLDQGLVWRSLGPREDIPCPAVLRPGDKYYDAFEMHPPVF